MTGPNLILPSAAMPWGRWVEQSRQNAEVAIRRQQSDANSVGSLFASRSSLLAGQIAGVSNVSTQYTTQIPTYTRSKGSGAFDDPTTMFESPAVTFTPPRPTGDYRVLIFGFLNGSMTGGTGLLDYAWASLMVDGKVFKQPTVEENRISQGTTTNPNKVVSLGGWTTVSNGAPTTVKLGLEVDPFNSYTIAFTGCKVTAVYIGGL